MIHSILLRNSTCHLVLLLIIAHHGINVNDVDAGSNDNFNYNYHRDQRMTHRTSRLMLNLNKDDHDIAKTIMNSDSTIRSTVLLRNKGDTDSFGGDGHRKSKLLVHDDNDDIGGDEDLLLRNRKNNLEETSPPRFMKKPLNLA